MLTESDSVVEQKSNEFYLIDWTNLNVALKYASFLQFLVIFGLNLNDDINPNGNDGHAILNNEFKKSATPY